MVLAENVPGLLTLQDGVVFEGVCADLEGEGYEVLPLVIPACAQGAPHRRDRVWIVAHAIGTGTRSIGREVGNQGRGTSKDRREGIRPTIGKACTSGYSPTDCHAPDTARSRLSLCWPKGRQGENSEGSKSPRNVKEENSMGQWRENWYEVASRFCVLANGLPEDLARPGRNRNRVQKLKALGNAVVPQIVCQIGKSILEADMHGRE